MIDMHSHILPNIDDGASDIEESINMIKEAYEVGFRKIISTSHFAEEKDSASIEERQRLINKLNEKLKKEEIDIEIYNGAEFYISPDVYELLENNELPTINGTKYLLMELPMNNQIMHLEEIIYNLKQRGITTIIAHPERYLYVQKNLKMLEELKEQGVLFQANYGSIIGRYGRKAQKTLKKLLKKDIINFLGTDAHSEKSIYTNINIASKKIIKIIGKEKFELLSNANPNKVLNNEDIYRIGDVS